MDLHTFERSLSVGTLCRSRSTSPDTPSSAGARSSEEPDPEICAENEVEEIQNMCYVRDDLPKTREAYRCLSVKMFLSMLIDRPPSLHSSIIFDSTFLDVGCTGFPGLILNLRPLFNIFFCGKTMEMSKVTGKRILAHKNLVDEPKVFLLEAAEHGRKVVVGSCKFYEFVDFGPKLSPQRISMLHRHKSEHCLTLEETNEYTEADHVYGLKMRDITMLAVPRGYATIKGQQRKHKKVEIE